MRPITPQQNTKMRLRMRLLAAVLAVVLAASTQTAFSDVMWSHVLYSLDTLPASTVTAVLRHALPLLSSTEAT